MKAKDKIKDACFKFLRDRIVFFKLNNLNDLRKY